MPTIGRIGALDVMIFRNDHGPPHFHVIGTEFSAKFTIADFELLSSKGRIRRRDIHDVEKWGHKHQNELYLNWELARAASRRRRSWIRAMLYEITDAVAHRDHTVTITWADGARGDVDFTPFIERGELFSALKEPDYFVREMNILRGGIGLTWPNEIDFSADGLRQDAFPTEQAGECDEPAGASVDPDRTVSHSLVSR